MCAPVDQAVLSNLPTGKFSMKLAAGEKLLQTKAVPIASLNLVIIHWSLS